MIIGTIICQPSSSRRRYLDEISYPIIHNATLCPHQLNQVHEVRFRSRIPLVRAAEHGPPLGIFSTSGAFCLT